MKNVYLIDGTVHSFSRVIAKEYGVNAAIVLGYIGDKIQRSKHFYEGRQWYYETLDSLAERYPYLGRTAIHEAIQRLTSNNGPLVVGNYNKKCYDRTKWYAFRNVQTAQLLKKKPLYFKVLYASMYGTLKYSGFFLRSWAV